MIVSRCLIDRKSHVLGVDYLRKRVGSMATNNGSAKSPR